MIIIRYSRKLGRPGMGGDWDRDTATIHHFEPGTGHTTCGTKIGTDIIHGGRWEKGDSRDGVTCERCVARNGAGS